MGRPAPKDPVAPPRWTVVLGPDDRVELLDGVIVTMAPHDVPHAAGVGRVEYWIVNLREDCVEVRRDPAPKERRYRSVRVVRRGEQLPIEMLPGVVVAVDDVLPTRRRSGAAS